MANSTAIPAIIMAGNPSLHLVSESIPKEIFGSQELRDLIDGMTRPMRDEGGAGIAAPQIGVNKRVFLYALDNDPRVNNVGSIPLTVVASPDITFFSRDIVVDYEACLSVGPISAKVPRSKKSFQSNNNG